MTVRRYRVTAPALIRHDSEVPIPTASLYINGERVGFVELEEIVPRYYVDPGTDRNLGYWFIHDRRDAVRHAAGNPTVAWFGPEHPDAEQAAALECQRLNELENPNV
jgi:hypothetical protein